MLVSHLDFQNQIFLKKEKEDFAKSGKEKEEFSQSGKGKEEFAKG